MPEPDSAAIIVARFLQSNHYTQTLSAFLEEARLPEDAASSKPGDWTLEQVLQEKFQFDTSVNFEKLGDGEDKGWTTPSPKISHDVQTSTFSNVLSVAAHGKSIFSSHADKSWNVASVFGPYETSSLLIAHSTNILHLLPFGDYVLATTMDGSLAIHASSGKLLGKTTNHQRWAVQVAAIADAGRWVIATAGWDHKVNIHCINPDHLGTSDDLFTNPVAEIKLQSNIEAIMFVRHPDNDNLYLLVARRDSTFINYYKLTCSSGGYEAEFDGRQNLAPHSNAWISFTPAGIASSPKDPTLLAVATNHTPHMKVILVRLLFPPKEIPVEIDTRESFGLNPPNYVARQARAEQALQDREEAAIKLQMNTMAPQSAFSTPQLVWRPDASGVWVNGDDGSVRGVEVKTGKVVATLVGHEAATKVRTLWSGYVPRSEGTNEMREVLVSGGFDKKVVVWECSD